MFEFKELSLESLYKRLGLHRVSQTDQEEINSEKYKSYIKILYLPAGYTITVDFKKYTTDSSSIFLSIATSISGLKKPERNQD